VLVDMVLHEVTRNQTPTSEKLAQWGHWQRLPVRCNPQTFQHYQQTLAANPGCPHRQSRRTGDSGDHERLRARTAAKDGCVPVRGPQNRPRQLSAAGQLPQGQHARLPDCFWNSKAGLSPRRISSVRAMQAGRSFFEAALPAVRACHGTGWMPGRITRTLELPPGLCFSGKHGDDVKDAPKVAYPQK
jgi:hypothetical protein